MPKKHAHYATIADDEMQIHPKNSSDNLVNKTGLEIVFFRSDCLAFFYFNDFFEPLSKGSRFRLEDFIECCGVTGWCQGVK